MKWYSALYVKTFTQDKLNHITSDCSYKKIQATRTDYYMYTQLKSFFSNNLCEPLLCTTSATRAMYFLGYVDTALESNIQASTYPDYLTVTAKYLRRLYSCITDELYKGL